MEGGAVYYDMRSDKLDLARLDLARSDFEQGFMLYLQRNGVDFLNTQESFIHWVEL